MDCGMWRRVQPAPNIQMVGQIFHRVGHPKWHSWWKNYMPAATKIRPKLVYLCYVYFVFFLLFVVSSTRFRVLWIVFHIVYSFRISLNVFILDENRYCRKNENPGNDRLKRIAANPSHIAHHILQFQVRHLNCYQSFWLCNTHLITLFTLFPF